MVPRRDIIAGLALEWYPPPTMADVLDWRVWCQCIEGDDLEDTLRVQAEAALAWACKWIVGHSTDTLALALNEVAEPAEYIPAVVAICDTIANSACLPDDVLQSMAAVLDKQNEVPAEYRAPGMCTCPRCRRGLENPKGVTCLYDDIDPRALRALSQVAGVEDMGERPYIAQVRGVMAHAEGRRLRYERQQREERDEYMSKLREKGVIRGKQ